jgi:hypothetical protein
MLSLEGGCLCGRVRFRVAAEPLQAGYCHCRMCQRNSGAPVVAWVTFPRAAFGWLAAAPASYASSARARRQFCPACGSYLTFESEDTPQEVSINTASLDEPARFAPQMHIFSGSRIPWFATADTLPQYPGYGPPPPPA